MLYQLSYCRLHSHRSSGTNAPVILSAAKDLRRDVLHARSFAALRMTTATSPLACSQRRRLRLRQLFKVEIVGGDGHRFVQVIIPFDAAVK